ncbi:PA2928 family protein [Streptomyces sp. NBRC 109706]|uniref:PA2928 family protein n=1 Tax=Streptomyces sp. NBRC 109706 TaxID=1550035 RepID=UPI0007830B80|nr:PA2928 family protein [Streptomyces sp. NBRC 109706]
MRHQASFAASTGGTSRRNPPRVPGLITSPYGTPDEPRTPVGGRPRRGVGLRVALLPLGIIGLVFGSIWHFMPDPTVSVQPGLGIAATPRGALALVPYERDGSSNPVQMISGDTWQKRLVAVDLNTGDRVWDVKLSGELIWEAAVLATSPEYAYLVTDDGLRIVDLVDGSTVAHPDEIPGLGADYIASDSAYAYDSARRAVVALDMMGEVRAIPLGGIEAAPADEDTTATWADRLGESSPSVDTEATTGSSASAGDFGSVQLRPRSPGAPAGTLVLTDPEGRERQLGGQVFRDGEILLTSGLRSAMVEAVGLEGVDSLPAEELAEQLIGMLPEEMPPSVTEQLREQLEAALDTGAEGLPGLPGLPDTAWLPGLPGAADLDEPTLVAMGADQGHVLIQDADDAAGENYRLTVVSLETGEIVSSRVIGAELGNPLSAPGGLSVLPAAPPDQPFDRVDELLLVDPDGSLRVVAIGGTDFFGNPN